jgi:carbon-monoxide dehydrogenase medium subunit
VTLPPFEIHRPASVSEASALLGGLRDDARAYAGGVALLLSMKQGLVTCGHLVDLKAISALSEIGESADGSIRIGATATHRAVTLSPLVRRAAPMLVEVASTLGNVRVRNVGTIGGSLCFGEPDSDPATALLALDARVRLERNGNARTVRVDDFLLGPFEVALESAELLTHVEVPRPAPRSGARYLRFGVLERPLVTVAAAVTLSPDLRVVEDTRIAIGCAGPRPFRAIEAEALLRGRSLDEALARLPEAGRAAGLATDAVADHRASVEYRKAIVDVLVRRAVVAARAAVSREAA